MVQSRGRSRTRRSPSSKPRRRSASNARRAGSARPNAKQLRRAAGMSADGIAFIKCATSSPDFGVDPGKGIPDRYTGRTVNIKDCFTESITFTPGTDTYIVVAPVPGVAYFKGEVAVNSAPPKEYTAVNFPTYPANFGTYTGIAKDGNNRDSRPISPNFTRFRYASLAAGLYPTSNQMQYGGALSVWKGDLSLAITGAGAIQTQGESAEKAGQLYDVSTHHVSGISSISQQAPRDNYTESFIEGAYTAAYDNSGDFDWCEFLYDPTYTSTEATIVEDKIVELATFKAADNTMLTGWGNTETIILKVTTPDKTSNTCAFRVWNCIELQVNTNSNMYQFAHTSPAFDPVALSAYAELRNQLPVAVPAKKNAEYWNRVLRLLHGAIRGVAHMPGPAGLIAKGIDQLWI